MDDRYLFDEIRDMIDAVLDNNRFLGFQSLALSLCLGLIQQTFLLRCFVFRPVLQKHLEQASSCPQTPDKKLRIETH